ncbi:MAG TPA: hypothetical protein VF980_04310 [Thermoanaerobaculia bacterium]
MREALARMVDEIRSSVDDVRAAVDSQLNAALQSMQADVNALSFIPHIKKTIGELEESIAAAAPPAPVGADASKLKRAMQAVERGKSQVDVLNGLLEQSLEFGSRAALLILRGDTFSGWKGVGFAAHGGNDEVIKRFTGAPGIVPQLDELLQQERVVDWDGGNLATRFGVAAPVRALLVPMVIKDKVAAAVYVDALAEDAAKLDRSAIEILVFTTGLLVDTLAIRKKIPSPSLSNETASVASARRPVMPAVAARPATPRPVAPAGPRPISAPAAPAPAAAQETLSYSAAQMRDLAVAPTPRPTPVPPPPPPPPPPTRAPEDRPSTQFVPPAGMGRGSALSGATSDETKKHDEARRFARLLVSEIKLYNESKVEAGRKNRDLYERLKDDIDRSRQMYDERIVEDVRKSSNYFYDELVRILADGNADALGL